MSRLRHVHGAELEGNTERERAAICARVRSDFQFELWNWRSNLNLLSSRNANCSRTSVLPSSWIDWIYHLNGCCSIFLEKPIQGSGAWFRQLEFRHLSHPPSNWAVIRASTDPDYVEGLIYPSGMSKMTGFSRFKNFTSEPGLSLTSTR